MALWTLLRGHIPAATLLATVAACHDPAWPTAERLPELEVIQVDSSPR